jgi:methylenetetrahydrofolate reductase (NADPH)
MTQAEPTPTHGDASPVTSNLEPAISFEFFPPKTAEMETRLWDAITRLAPLEPRFVSVTYGADGSTRGRTHATVARILKETALTPAAHLTCVGAARGEVEDVARAYWDLGVRHIVALRGDAPQGDEGYRPHPEGFAYASDLVAGLRRVAEFEISVAAFPEVHPEAASAETDLDNLKRKLDAGACRAITQFFFDPACYLRFRDRAAASGITAPIVPGIFPITNFPRTVEFAAKCGASIPDWLHNLFQGLDDDPGSRNLVAAATAAEQCRYLQAHGVEEFHFYTLNRSEMTAALVRMLRAPATPWAEGGEVFPRRLVAGGGA